MITNYRIINSYQGAGVEKEYYLDIERHIVEAISFCDFKMLNSLLQLFAPFYEQDDKYFNIFRAVSYELDRYNENGILRDIYN